MTPPWASIPSCAQVSNESDDLGPLPVLKPMKCGKQAPWVQVLLSLPQDSSSKKQDGKVSSSPRAGDFLIPYQSQDPKGRRSAPGHGDGVRVA